MLGPRGHVRPVNRNVSAQAALGHSSKAVHRAYAGPRCLVRPWMNSSKVTARSSFRSRVGGRLKRDGWLGIPEIPRPLFSFAFKMRRTVEYVRRVKTTPERSTPLSNGRKRPRPRQLPSMRCHGGRPCCCRGALGPLANKPRGSRRGPRAGGAPSSRLSPRKNGVRNRLSHLGWQAASVLFRRTGRGRRLRKRQVSGHPHFCL